MSRAQSPILSVLIPTYNSARFITAAIQSVLDQGVSGVEIVVADDGSTDNTAEVLRMWIEAGVIRYFSQPNSGPSSARNLALKHARGGYLMLLDADDLLYSGCIQATLDFLDRHKNVAFFFTNYDIFDENGLVQESGVDSWKIFRTIPHREAGPGEWIFGESLAPWIIQYGGFMSTSGLTLKREVVEEAGPFLDGYFHGEDDEFYARLTYCCTAGYLDRVFSRVRNHATSLIHDPANRLRNARQMLELSEIQRSEYHDDDRIQEILRKKIRIYAIGYIWGLLERGLKREVRATMREYLPRYPLHLPFYKLLIRSFLREPRKDRIPDMESSTWSSVPATTARGPAPWESRLERLVHSIRRYRPEDRDALHRFQTRYFGGQARQVDEARFRWLFEKNPWMDEAGPGIWLWEREKIVGQQSGIVHRLKIGTEEVRASWAVDLMVDPAWRLRGVGPALSERHARSHPVVIGLGASDQLFPSLLRSGWTDMGCVPCRIRPLRLSELGPWSRRRPVRRWLARHFTPPLTWTADRWGDVVLRRAHVRLEAVASFDERADDIWRLVAPEHLVVARRDAAALRWRFDLSPDASLYQRFLLLHEETPAGYLVLREGTMLDVPVIFLADYLCPLRLMDALLTLVNTACWEKSAVAVVCNALHLRAAAAFTRAGFFSRKWEAKRLLWRTQPGLARVHPILRDRTNWFVTRADSDWDHHAAGPFVRPPDSF